MRANCSVNLIALMSFFFQAEDGIRDGTVTGVQTCALPIFCDVDEIIAPNPAKYDGLGDYIDRMTADYVNCRGVEVLHQKDTEIGRASCRERVWITVVAVFWKTNKLLDGVDCDYIGVVELWV